MNNRLLSSVRLPFAQTRGTIEIRQQNARQLVDKLYNNIHDKFVQEKMSIDDIEKHIKAILPEQLNVRVLEGYDSRFSGAYSDIIYAGKIKKIIGTTIEVATRDKLFKKENLATLLHEFQHITDQIYHPKYLSRAQRMINTGLITERYNNLYENLLYTPEFAENKKEKQRILKRIEHKLHKFLRRKSAEVKLDYIQDARNTLQMELEAYTTQQKYAKIMKEMGLKFNEDELLDFTEIFMFKEKIELLKRMGFEIIQKERQKFAAKLKKLRNVNITQK